MDLRLVIGGLSLVLGILAGSQLAAAQGPAVSAPNGKFEFDAGALSMPSSFVGRIAGTLTLPVGDSFGIQADFSAADVGGFTGSTALHVFTRDPQSYLIGGTLGAMWTPGASIVAAGPEAELYMDRWTIEAWGGAAIVHPGSGPSRTGVFGMADLAYYPTDNFRVSTGLSLLDGYAALHLGAEYLFDDSVMPVALTGDARLGQDGSVLATVGLRFYVGAPSKSLILRHREDDPWDRGASLFTAVGGFGAPAGTPTGTSNPPDDTTDPPDDPPTCNPITEQLVDGVCVPYD